MLRDKICAVTGGGRGIGREISLCFARHGAAVAVFYGSGVDAAEETVNKIRILGVRAQAYKCDVRSFSGAAETLSRVVSEFGRLDILVNNAGITRDGLLASMSEDSFDSVIETNLKGAFNMIRHASRYMIKQKNGRIINISSVAGIRGNQGQSNYASSKAGLIGLTKAAARELAPRGITCNAIAPGFIESDMTAPVLREGMEKALDAIPLARIGRPEDVAELAAFLASEGAGYITGEIIRVDGGMCI